MNPHSLLSHRHVLRAVRVVAALTAWPAIALAQPVTLKTFTDAATEGRAIVAPLAIRSDGQLFGAANAGGANGLGTLFSVAADGTGFTVLRHLDSAVSGYSPNGGLVVGGDGRLYGTMNFGGPTNRGTLFALNADGTGFTILRYFAGADGTYPVAGVTQGADGKLYGATTLDGASGWGTIYRVNPDGSGFTVLHTFANDAGGGQPQGTPVFGPDGRLYGTTYRGGAFGSGTVFALNADGTGFVVLRSFAGGTDGAQPYTGVTAGADGTLYGTTNFGGTFSGGTVYRLQPDGSGYAILRHLGSVTPEGNGPFYSLPTLSGGRLYVTAGFNGSGGAGSVFSLNTDGTGFALELSFSGTGKPLSGVRAGPDGRLYGTTREGGAGGLGTIFRIGAPIASPVPSFQGVGDLPGGIFFSEVRDATRVAGVLVAVGGSSAHTGSSNVDTGFRWTSSGGIAALPDVVANTTGTNPVMASAITRHGDAIASRARSVATGNGGRVAVKVTNAGATNTVLGYLPGGATYSAANALSDDGAVLYGFSRVNDSTGVTQAFRWTAATGLVAVPFLAPGDLSNFPAGRGASADGAVMIGTSTSSLALTGSGNHAYVYAHGAGVAPLPELSGGTWSIGLAVTSDGGTLLGAGDSPARPNGALIRWDGDATSLGSPDAALAPSNFGGLSDDGVAVVSFFPAAGGDGTAFIRNSHGWSVLADALAAAGLNLTDWTLTDVLGISPDGTLVFGRGVHAGNREGWVAELAPGYLAGYFSDHVAPVLALPSALVVEATSAAGATVNFAATAHDAHDGDLPVSYSIAPGSVFPLGTTTVSVTAADLAGNVVSGTFTVTVVDTTAPVFTSLTANPAVLRPANRKLVDVTLSATATDAAGAPVTFRILSVTSNLPGIGHEHGEDDDDDHDHRERRSKNPDIVITGPMTLRLRAEFAARGRTRIYTVTVEARDAAGNTSTATVTVRVPHGRD